MTTITGTSGDDTLIGTSENDELFANGGTDTVLAGAGDDNIALTLVGGSAGGTLDGGDGNDNIALDATWKDVKNLTIMSVGPAGYITGDGVTFSVSNVESLSLDFSQLSTAPIFPLPEYLGEISISTAGAGGISFGGTLTSGVSSGGYSGVIVNETVESISPGGISLSGSGAAITITGAVSASGTISSGSLSLLQAGSGGFVNGVGSVGLTSTTTSTAGAGTITGGTGDDSLGGGKGADTLSGGGGADTLDGGAGKDTLDGGTGADTLIGGKGNDTYIIDDAGDVVVENTSEGNDLVKAVVSHTLAANAENLALTGTADIDGTGNSLANTLTGNAGANALDGAGGKDKLTGGKGDDAYTVDLASTGRLEDTITESANAGSDTIVLRGDVSLSKAVALTLANNLENLDASATGSTLLNLNGNSVANMLTGNVANNTLDGKGGDDTLIGGAGRDTLTGGKGDDTFVFDTLPASSAEADLIKDFVSGSDHLAFDTTLFDALAFTDGALAAEQFAAGAGMTDATDAATRLLYDSSTGDLYYDSDGNGASAATLLASLGTTSHPGLAATDLIAI